MQMEGAVKSERKPTAPKQPSDTDEALTEDLVRAFVWNPNDVHVTRRGEGGGDIIIYELDVNPADYGAVVGKGGRKITALQAIVQCFGLKTQKKIRLILPPRDRPANAMIPEPFRPDVGWKPEKTVELLRRVLAKILTSEFNIGVISTAEQTTLEIMADKNDNAWLEAMTPFLHTVFHAIGKNDGHDLHVKQAMAVTA